MDRGLRVEVYEVELRTLGDALMHHALFFECRTCWKLSPFEPPAGMSHKTPLREIRRKAKCRDCERAKRNYKNVHILRKKNGIRGDYAWEPRPPGRKHAR